MVAGAGLSGGLQRRLQDAGIGIARLGDGDSGAFEAWLQLRAHFGRRATLVDLYELEAASRGVRPQDLPASDRERLKALSRAVRHPGCADVPPGSDRHGDSHEVISYDPAWPELFLAWRGRLAATLGRAATRIDHVGSTSVPGLAAKPVIDIQVSVPDVADESSYLSRAESAGLILRLREHDHRFLWPPPARARDVHVHICATGGAWERDHLLFRDYLRSHAAVRDNYAALKRELIQQWRHDRKAYGEAKTGFVLDTLADASQWAARSQWRLSR